MSALRRNITQIATGTLASQLLLLAATPVLTRLYGPAAFGGLALFTTFYGLLAGIGTLRYELSIPAPRQDRQATLLSGATLVSAAGFAGTTTMLVGVGLWFGLPGLQAYHLMLPGCMLLIALHCVTQQWSARNRHYARYATSLLLNSAVNIATALVLAGVGQPDAGSLVAGVLVGLVAANVYMLWPASARNQALGALAQWRHRRGMLGMARRQRAFPTFMLPAFVLTTAATSAPVLILGALRTQAEVGLYAIALRFLLTPSVILGSAVSEALRAEMFQRQRDQAPLLPLVKRVLRLGLMIGLPCLALAFAVGADVLVFILGPHFEPAGELVNPLALSALATVLLQPLQNVFMVLGKQSLALLSQVALGLLPNIALAILAGVGRALPQALAGYAVTHALLAALCMAWIWRTVSRNDQTLIDMASATAMPRLEHGA